MRTHIDTFDEYKRKNENRFKNLSNREWLRKYEAYASSAAGQNQEGRQRRQESSRAAFRTANKVSRTSRKDNATARLEEKADEKQVARLLRKHLKENEYFMAMAHPFDSGPQRVLPCAKVPSMETVPTSTFQIRWNVPLFCNNNGTAAIYFRPALQACYAVTNQEECVIAPGGVTCEDAPYDTAQMVFNAGGQVAEALGQGIGTWTLGSWAVGTPGLQDVPSVARIMEAFTDYRITAAGVQYDFTAQARLQSGVAVSAHLPGSYGVPWYRSATFNLNPNLGIVTPYGRYAERPENLDSVDAGPTFKSLSNLERINIIDLEEHGGVESIWYPLDDEAATDFRPTRYVPPARLTVLDQVTDPVANPERYLMPPCCPGDPAAWRSSMNMLYNLNGAVQRDGGAGLWFAADPGVDLDLATGATQAMLRFQMTTMADGENAIMIVFEGLTARNGTTVGGQVGYVEFVMNIEAIVEQRTFSLSNPARSIETDLKRHTALHAIQDVPTSRTPIPPENVVQEHAKTIRDTASTVAEAVTSTGESIGEIIGTVADIGSMIAAFL